MDSLGNVPRQKLKKRTCYSNLGRLPGHKAWEFSRGPPGIISINRCQRCTAHSESFPLATYELTSPFARLTLETLKQNIFKYTIYPEQKNNLDKQWRLLQTVTYLISCTLMNTFLWLSCKNARQAGQDLLCWYQNSKQDSQNGCPHCVTTPSHTPSRQM